MNFTVYRILPSPEGNWLVVVALTGAAVAICPTRREARQKKWELEQHARALRGNEADDAVVGSSG